MPDVLIIGDHNWQQHAAPPVLDGERKAMGLIPRNFETHPRGCYNGVKAVDIKVIPRSEWSQRCKDKAAQKGQLSDIMLDRNVPCLDQNGKGYCWAHSTTGAVQAARAVMNEPTVELSAYAVACVIKQFRDEGGWGAQSADFITQRGVPSSAFWPQRNMSRANDNPKTWENAALHKIGALWADMTQGQYDRNLTFDQYATCWLTNQPTVCDFNWWSHSVMGCDLVDGSTQRHVTHADSGKLATLWEFEAIWGMNDPVTAGFGCRPRNSWGLSYGDRGFFILTGSKAIPDGGVGLLIATPSVN